MVNLIIYSLVRFLLGVLGLIPYQLRCYVVAFSLRLATLFSPSYRKVSLKNLNLAFPDKNNTWQRDVIAKNFLTLGIIISDFIRLPKLDSSWVVNYFEFPYLERYREIKRGAPNKGILVATGHLGSFELMAFSMSLLGHPLSFIVRNFKLPLLDRWWNSIREMHGNKVIARNGAYREIVKGINKGRDVGVLFDQNVKRRHAIFVNWFGRKAATTKSLALAALETESIVVVCSLQVLAFNKYRMNVVECDFNEIYSSKMLSRQEKIEKITETISLHYQDMIKNYPEGWFWMHRRWKTTETESEPENFYSS